ncbi:carcinoembryonic antigen-related cell adhesion molecule 19 [Choloepus didactylus]|uniref:carcinoembryonic antigen-related cell adhesion molecule 19 n=1 Tax=Choloepus didactylus TaxID=27675 RepID=UPI0018A0AA4B|nr:carcinoembryonic antigen-related cell adhesion molecule 19 [Choloepus didactylus]
MANFHNVSPSASQCGIKMETLTEALGPFSKGLLLSATILAIWIPQDSWAVLHIQKIPEQPQKNQDLLLSVEGIPDTFQDLNWYLGEEISGSTRLFSYIPGLQRPQRDGNAMGQRDIVGFPNGSMLLRRAQPTDSGTYQVAIAMNTSWTMRAKTEVQVAEQPKELPVTHWPANAGIMAAIIIGSLAMGTLLVGSITYLLVARGWRGQSHRVAAPRGQGSLSVLYPAVSPAPTMPPGAWLMKADKPELGPSHYAADGDIYEVMPSPVFVGSPLGDNPAMPPPLPPPLRPKPENHPYQQELLNPDPAPYCQLVPTPWPGQRGEDKAPGLS